MGVQVPELKQCVQSFHFIVLSSSLSSLLVLLLFREILLFVVFGAVAMRFGFAMTISLPRFSLLFLAPNKTPSDEAKRSSHHHHHLIIIITDTWTKN